MSVLRPYQQELKDSVYAGWNAGNNNVLAVLPCGGGKTFIFTDIMKEHRFPLALAHRDRLVSQMSLTLGVQGVYHKIIAPSATIREIVKLHMLKLGQSFYDPVAHVTCAGVDTLVRRNFDWFASVDLWVVDEAHHVIRDNKWGKAIKLFPNARGLGVTATPCRADGKGLGSHADGVFDLMTEGPTGRDIINMGSLSDYDVAIPTNSIDRESIGLSAGGDFSPVQLAEASKKSTIVGDVVEWYLKLAKGKLGLTFAPTIDIANQITRDFNAAGIPAVTMSSKTPTIVRVKIFQKFESRELLQIVNVDLLGEGVDVPALEVISMARPTESYSLYVQQFMRPLRPLEGKDKALIIDHVGNVIRHRLPDGKKIWTLDAREKRSKSHPSDDDIPLKVCPNPICNTPYHRILVKCPSCGHVPVPIERAGPEQVDGDLELLDPEMLKHLRGEVGKVDGPAYLPANVLPKVAGGITKNHRERKAMQVELRQSIAQWGGYATHAGHNVRESQKLFYIKFGVDVMSAQSLGRKEAESLKKAIDTRVNNGAL